MVQDHAVLFFLTVLVVVQVAAVVFVLCANLVAVSMLKDEPAK
jgi:hypothetical protein